MLVNILLETLVIIPVFWLLLLCLLLLLLVMFLLLFLYCWVLCFSHQFCGEVALHSSSRMESSGMCRQLILLFL